MKFNELTVSRQRKSTRVGRGISGGKGKTAGRGTKGQGSRKSPVRQGFEGGQMPLYMRLPKLRGFKSHKPAVETVYTGQLDELKKNTVNATVLADAGLISSPYVYVKLIVKGEVKGKFNVQLPFASKNAAQLVEKAGGSYKETPRLARPAKKAKTEQ